MKSRGTILPCLHIMRAGSITEKRWSRSAGLPFGLCLSNTSEGGVILNNKRMKKGPPTVSARNHGCSEEGGLNIMTTNKEEYIDRMARDLREWSADIDEFERIASRASTDRLEDYEQSMRNLREKRDLLSSRLQDLRGSTSEAWTELEPGIETAKHELRDAFESARITVKKVA
jgi:hypothetical protein